MKAQLHNYLYVIIVLFLLLGLIVFKGEIADYVARLQARNVTIDHKNAMTDTIARRYDYRQNGLSYEATFLEFGATTCHSCKLMIKVMDEIKQQQAGKVNVVFIDVRLPENKEIIEYFGISSIPAQVLLGRDGKEYYRHTGYISADDLQKKLGTP